nr:reverse transcriptase domain-containing protein [Tanacetum cinerariifolium]
MRTRRSYFSITTNVTIPRRRRKQISNIVEPELRTMADNQVFDNRTMAQMLQAPIEGYEDAIVVPPINANNFELKQTLINLVQSNQFTDALESAAGGNFLDKIPRDGLAIIESKSKVRYLRSRVTDSRDFVTSPAPIKAVEEVCVTGGSNHSYNHCPLTRGRNEFPIFHDNIQQFQTAAVGNFAQGNPSSSSSLPRNTIPNPRNKSKAITTRSGISYDGPPILPPIVEKEPDATKDTELSSTKNIQPPSVQVYEKDKEPVDKPFDVPKTKTNLPYPSRLISINLNSQHLDKEKQEVKNVMEQPAERRTRIIESLHNFRVIYKSSISLKDTSQISPVHAVAPILSTKEPEYSTSMGYEHANTTPKTESDEIIKFGVGELVQILSENDVTSEDKRECDMLFCENSLICDDHYEISFDSKNDNDEQSLTLKCGDTLSISYNNFESLNKVDLIDATCEEYSQEVLGFSDVVASGNPTPYYDPIVSNSSPTLTSFDESDFFLHEQADTFIAINDEPISPKIDATYYDPEGDILYFENLLKEDPFQLPPMNLKIVEDSKEKSFVNEPPEVELKEFSDELAHINPEITEADFDFEKEIHLIEKLLIMILKEGEIDAVEELHVDNSISNSKNELSDNEASDFDNPSFLRPPPKPPDVEFDFKLDTGEEISVVMNTIDELECLDPRDEFDNDDCFYFMFVI